MSRLAATIPEPARTGAVELSDRRRLGWAEWGPLDAWPVLFFSGAAMGRSLGFGADCLTGLGVRVIAVDRPGIGASDPCPDRTLADWPGDVEQLVAALSVEDHGLVAFSMGAPSALACAAAGLPRAVAIVSGQDDLRASAFADRITGHLAGMLAQIDADPEGFAAGFAEQATPDLIWSLAITGSSEVDLAVYADPAFARAYRRSLAEGFAQGPAGYALDFALAAGRWPFAPEQIGVPVELWYGGRDLSSVHSPDGGALLASRIPGAIRNRVEEGGAAVLWTHADQILSALVQARWGRPAAPDPSPATKGAPR